MAGNKTYRLRRDDWFEDTHQLIEDIEEELEFKKDVENKISQPFQFNLKGHNETTGEPSTWHVRR